jgi:hypothetical protein
MGGLGKDTLQAAVGVALGSVGARALQKVIPGNGKLISGGQIVLGGIIASKAKSAIMRGAGYGCMATGVVDLMTQSKMLGAVDDEGYTALVPMAGFIEDPISGFDEDVMNGVSDMPGWDKIQGVDDNYLQDPISGPGEMTDDLEESVVGYNY